MPCQCRIYIYIYIYIVVSNVEIDCLALYFPLELWQNQKHPSQSLSSFLGTLSVVNDLFILSALAISVMSILVGNVIDVVVDVAVACHRF